MTESPENRIFTGFSMLKVHFGVSYDGVVRKKLFRFLQETGMSRYRFSQLSGISTSTLADMEKRPDYDIRESNIFKVCKGMGITPVELFQSEKK